MCVCVRVCFHVSALACASRCHHSHPQSPITQRVALSIVVVAVVPVVVVVGCCCCLLLLLLIYGLVLVFILIVVFVGH